MATARAGSLFAGSFVSCTLPIMWAFAELAEEADNGQCGRNVRCLGHCFRVQDRLSEEPETGVLVIPCAAPGPAAVGGVAGQGNGQWL